MYTRFFNKGDVFMVPATSDRLLKPTQVRQMLGISTSNLRRINLSGAGPKVYRLGEKTKRYRESEVQAWLESKSVGA
jgi:predicted DNA-binding transcriptional regulator AlpA